jgi:hypothetical protein
MLDRLYKMQSFLCSADLLELAARRGHAQVIEWFRALDGFSWDSKMTFAAIAEGHMPVLEYLCENSTQSMRWSAAVLAAACGRLPILQFTLDKMRFEDEGEEVEESLSSAHCLSLACAAARAGHSNLLRWMLTAQGWQAEVTHRDVYAAAASGK